MYPPPKIKQSGPGWCAATCVVSVNNALGGSGTIAKALQLAISIRQAARYSFGTTVSQKNRVYSVYLESQVK